MLSAGLLAVLSSIAYGAADFCGGLASKRTPVLAVVVISQFAGLAVLLVALPLLPRSSPSPADLAWGTAAGIAGGVGVALLYRALSTGVMNVVAPATAVCAVLVPLAVGIASGERPAVRALAGVVLAIVAIVLVSQSGGEHATTGLSTAIAAGIVIGFFLVWLARSGPQAGMWPLVASRAVSGALFIVLGRKNLVPARAALPLIIGGGVLDMGANVLYLVAVRIGMLSIVATLASLYPASTIVLARIVLHERLRAVQMAGVCCAAAAIVLIVAR